VRDQHPNGISPLSVSIKIILHGVAQRIHNSVVEEFWESYLDQTSGIGASEAEMEDQPEQDAHQTTDPAIELQEFPWATGNIGDIETAVPVASSQQTWILLPQLC